MAFAKIIVFLLLFFLFSFLALDRQIAVDEFLLDVLLIKAWQFRSDFKGVSLVDDVDGGKAPGELGPLEWLHLENRAAERRQPGTPIEIFENLVDLSTQNLERMPSPRRRRLFLGFYRRYC